MSADGGAVDATWFDDVSDFGGGQGLGQLRVAGAPTEGARIALAWRDRELALRAGQRFPGTGLRLVRLMADGVLLDNGGAFQWLPLGAQWAMPDTNPGTVLSPAFDDRRDDPAARAVAQRYHRKLYRNMLALIGAVHVVTPPGTMGFTVFPGVDEAGFYALGLKPGDRITGVNGFRLTDFDSALLVYGALTDAATFTLTLTRAGATQVILLSKGAENDA